MDPLFSPRSLRQSTKLADLALSRSTLIQSRHIHMIHLGSRRELMVDKFLVDSFENLTHVQHSPTFANEALRFDKPWEGNFCGYCTVIHDQGEYRLYYRGWPVDASGDKAGEHTCLCLATSTDGVTFTRPNFGLHEFLGHRDNNVIVTVHEAAHNFSPFIDNNPLCDPRHRYKAFASCLTGKKRHSGKNRRGLQPWGSPDGINWAPIQEAAVFDKGAFDSQNIAFWSEHENCYVAYFRVYDNGGPEMIEFAGRRTVARATSTDFLHWSNPVMMEIDWLDDEEFYTSQTQPYFRAPHIYLAFPKRFVKNRRAITDQEMIDHKVIPRYAEEISDAMFFSSRANNKYDRIGYDAFLLNGTDPGNWVSRTNMAALNVVQTGNELSLYYQHGYSTGLHRMNRYTLRIDGFGSYHADGKGGRWTTKPLTFTGSKLNLNLRTSAIGSIKIALLDESGAPFPGFAASDCDMQLGDRLEKTVTWKGSSNLSSLSDKKLRLQFTMREADLFSFKFE